MDFRRDDTQDSVAEVVVGVLERGADKSADEVWASFRAADLLSLALPERLGGADLGLPAVTTLLTEIGAAAAQLPALATFGLGVPPLLASGDAHDALLARVADGAVLSAGLNEPGAPLTPTPATSANGNVVNGVKIGVPYADVAAAILVPTDSGVFAIDPRSPGVTLTQTPSSSGAPEFAVRFVDVSPGAFVTTDLPLLHRYAVACMGAVADGLLRGATDLTARHLATRHQFGKPLATFQAVAQEIADVYVVSRTLHVAALSAAWRISEGLDADSDLDVLAYWIAEEVPQAMRTCHHLHGGIGVDVTYPMHRFSSQMKDLARALGGPTHRLELLGVRCSSI